MIVSISGSEIHACGARQETNNSARAIIGANFFIKKKYEKKYEKNRNIFFSIKKILKV